MADIRNIMCFRTYPLQGMSKISLQFLTTTKGHREQVNPKLQEQPETKPECQEVLAHSFLKDKKANTDKIDEKENPIFPPRPPNKINLAKIKSCHIQRKPSQ